MSFFEISPTPSSLTSVFVFLIRRFADERLGRDLVAGLEAVEVADVHRHGRGAERADRHRVLRRVAAQLADAHVDRHLAALEPGAHLVRARARLLALDPAAGVAALARAGPAADALAVLALLRRLEVREVQLSSPSSGLLDLHEVAHLPQHACEHGVSSCSAPAPILPRPSARSVPRWRSLWPIWAADLRDAELRHLRVVLLLRGARGASALPPPRERASAGASAAGSGSGSGSSAGAGSSTARAPPPRRAPPGRRRRPPRPPAAAPRSSRPARDS